MKLFAILAAVSCATAAQAEFLVQCPAGRWEGYQVGFRSYSGPEGENGPNGIGYPSTTMIFKEDANFGDQVYIEFGGNYVSPEGFQTSGVVTFRSPGWTPADYVIIHAQPQQIAEVFTFDLKAGTAILNQTIGDHLGISVDTFKRQCTVEIVDVGG